MRADKSTLMELTELDLTVYLCIGFHEIQGYLSLNLRHAPDGSTSLVISEDPMNEDYNGGKSA